jgi:hypothetical protein
MRGVLEKLMGDVLGQFFAMGGNRNAFLQRTEKIKLKPPKMSFILPLPKNL